MEWVWTHSKAKKGSRLTLLAIADCASADGSNAFPSMAELMRKTGLSERGVQAAVSDLERLGELAVERISGKGNRYRVVMTSEVSRPPQNPTPAESAPPQNLRGAEDAPPQNSHPAESAPTPAESAGVTVTEPSGCSLPTEENKDARTRDSTSGDSSKPKRKRATKSEMDERERQAQDLTTKFFERYETAQQFIAIRQVLRGALGNGISRDNLARAIDRLGREGKPISGASIQFVLGQFAEEQQRRNGHPRGASHGQRVTTPPRTSPRNRWMERE
ncbi:helix-turn-helix domain-containing protein [Nonomuraea sp. CA-218870]|uniref:helix-turn-helix domain-containing protein n=1 Tax=Nonomuraea sp. CA-218870 TaxID=3239998 RepID=UPI003D8A40AA